MTQQKALEILKTGANVFLTGEPGAGKSHTINEYVSYLRLHGLEPSITASTGIAATHIGGMTIHSWSGIGIKTHLDEYDLDKIASTEYISKRIRRTKVLIIDEVSMLRPETISMVDAVCREVKQNHEPFGGLQVIFVGDFFQLPPIVKKQTVQQELLDEEQNIFAYESPSWKNAKLVTCYLDSQYRQDDEKFLGILSAIRNNIFDEMHLEFLEERKIFDKNIPEKIPKLFSHNVDVDNVNDNELKKIDSDVKIFEMVSSGGGSIVASLKKGCLSPEKLLLKVGASVMFTKNNSKEGFSNGTLGEIVSFSNWGNPIVKIKNGKEIEVMPMDWTVEENGKIKGQITQVPLRLAWAITVHKSQGMSLDEAVMDLSNVFEFGQGYVALSRVRRLSGLFLLGWNAKAFEVHPNILDTDLIFRENSKKANIAFGEINKDELQKMHDNFIVACGGIKNTNLKNENNSLGKIDTYSKTLDLWQTGESISDIAKLRKMTLGTIISHIEKLVEEGKIEKADVSRVFSPKLEKEIHKIHSVFRDIGKEKLSAVFQKLGGKCSYEDLRLARIVFDK